MKKVSPTDSYSLVIPEDVIEEYDGRVASYWKKDHDTLLQLSSYRRMEGEQVTANERLLSRLKQENLKKVKILAEPVIDCPDIASAEGMDHEGLWWLYIYAVWNDLTILITVTDQRAGILKRVTWVSEAIKTIRRGK